MEVIRGAGGENELRRERGSESPESCGPQATEPRDKDPGVPQSREGPHPLSVYEGLFLFSAPCAFGMTLIVLVSCVMELDWGRQRSVDDGIMEGLWQRRLRRKEEEREMGSGSAKLSLNKKRVFVCFVCSPPPILAL